MVEIAGYHVDEFREGVLALFELHVDVPFGLVGFVVQTDERVVGVDQVDDHDQQNEDRGDGPDDSEDCSHTLRVRGGPKSVSPGFST